MSNSQKDKLMEILEELFDSGYNEAIFKHKDLKDTIVEEAHDKIMELIVIKEEEIAEVIRRSYLEYIHREQNIEVIKDTETDKLAHAITEEMKRR